MRGTFILSKKKLSWRERLQTGSSFSWPSKGRWTKSPMMLCQSRAQNVGLQSPPRKWKIFQVLKPWLTWTRENSMDIHGVRPHLTIYRRNFWFGLRFLWALMGFLLVCFSIPSIPPVIMSARNTCISGRMKPKILLHMSQVNTDLNGKSKGCPRAQCQLRATQCQESTWVYSFRPPKQSCPATSPSLISRISSSTLFQIVFIELFQYIPDSVAVIHHIILPTYTTVLLGYIKIATNV